MLEQFCGMQAMTSILSLDNTLTLEYNTKGGEMPAERYFVGNFVECEKHYLSVLVHEENWPVCGPCIFP